MLFFFMSVDNILCNILLAFHICVCLFLGQDQSSLRLIWSSTLQSHCPVMNRLSAL
uniref:Uncharacterized protein n=1 Tax=Anguilla anguilla TaxID=7936 RepID=A0A0E9Q2E1_ANGAN